jgi:hypothetical protein
MEEGEGPAAGQGVEGADFTISHSKAEAALTVNSLLDDGTWLLRLLLLLYQCMLCPPTLSH